MFTPIHQALGIEPGELSIELIERAVEEGVQETASLDWKSEFYNFCKPGWDDEAAKDIAAMANSGGGWIVFGIIEEKETSAASQFKPIHWNSDKQQRILRTAYAHIGPSVLGLEFFALPKDDGHIVMMRIPDSHDAPHFAKKGNGAFVCPRRNGPHTAFMSDREIERSFRERFQRRDDDEQQLQHLYEQTGRSIDLTSGVCLSIVAIPREPSHDVTPLPEKEVVRFINPPICKELVSAPSSGPLISWDCGQVSKGLRQWRIRSVNNDRFVYRKFLLDDGSIACIYKLGAIEDKKEAAAYFPVGRPNHCLSIHIETAIVNFISLLRSYAIERHINGGYRIRVGLIGNPENPIFIRIGGGSCLLSDINYADRIDSFQPLMTELDPLAPITDILPIVNELATDIINQGGVRYLKIIANPDNFGA
ncbi:divergent AAA domain protein [Actinomyces graevenitzii F0530]|jgi:hypothetical protein|uniref:Divergent AAA domain protein n=1 Tax=Actinomyces graevenitzii F0530 TaxID=1321817 RepID=U1R9P2_9ACTO|nr:ATP-binding protein [Actinomyces graevenitzii]ERH15237.1 divergent AAA domain protein [Actinomyces graevenitzii F0530]